MALYGPATSRPLPQPPMYGGKDRDATWYEHEERMRPSYISQPMYQQPAFYTASPPVSPSARWNTTQQATVASTQVLPSSVSQRQMASRQPLPQPQPHSQQQHPFPSAPHRKSYDPLAPQVISRSPQREQLRPTDARPRPQHLNSAPSRFQNAQNLYRPFSYDNEEGGQRTGMAKGSAFMHKGFFDIMSLMNNQTSPSRSNGQMPANVGGLKATFSKATGRFRRTSMQAAPPSSNNEDPFFSSPAPQMIPKIGSPPNLSPPSNRMSISPAPASISAGTALGGPRAQKKRISIDMVGAPQVESFVHAAHASDAEQAETILRRWSRDGVGKIADPAWIDRCKEAMRMQAARNQAEAIAEVQAALHQDSLISQNPRALQVKNGAPSPSSVNNSNFTFATNATGATIGHTNLSADSGTTVKTPGFEGIAEEHEIVKRAPLTPQRSPYASPPIASRPGMMPRTNTQGTILVAPSPDPAVLASAAESTPDYLQYQPNPAQSPLADATKNRMTNKNIDGLPGGAGGINALFERPVSIVLREAAIEPVALNLAGEELASPLVANAGAALRPSLTTVEKSVAAKIFFENLYYGILKKPRDRDTRKAGLERELASLRISDTAKNAIRAAWSANETEYLRDLRARVTVNSFVRLKTIGHGAFGVVALVREQGTGGLFAMKQLRKADMLRKGQEGHVRAERDLMTSASASTSARWIVKLVYSFQDVDHLYLIMEFMGGGDLLNLLIEKDIFAEDFARFYVAEMILAIHEAHHLGYIHRDIKPDNFLFSSEGHIKLADFGLCQSFHWAHDGAYYDQQRKNMLKKHGIDLEDSGATRTRKALPKVAASVREQQQQKAGGLNERELNDVMSDRNEDGTPLTHVLTWRDKNKKKIAYSVVGTNNYMAPEVLRGLGYDQSCDWWSLGVIVFEMLYGYPPFVSKSRHLTRQKILNWKQTLRFPPKPKVSREAQDFITRLICDREDRLGSTSSASVSRPNSLLQGSRQPSGFAAGSATPEGSKSGLVDGVEDLMAHPWFRSVDWNRIHTSKPPFKPALSHPADTKHFEDDIEDEPLPAPGAAEAAKDGQPAPVEPPRDPMLRDKTQGKHLLEMRKQLAFVGYTFKSPKGFDPKTQLTESKIRQAEEGSLSRQPTESGSRLRSMSM